MFDKILLPVDGSEIGDGVAHVAADLASRYGAEVIVFHVREQKYVHGVGISPEEFAEATELVDRHVRRMKDAGLSARGAGSVALVRSHSPRDPRRRRRRERRPHRDGDPRAIRVEPAGAWKRRPQCSPVVAGGGARGPRVPSNNSVMNRLGKGER